MQVALVGGSGDALAVEKTGVVVTEAALDVFSNFVEVCAAKVGNKSGGEQNTSQPRRSARFATCPSAPEPCLSSIPSLPTPVPLQVRSAVSHGGWAKFQI